MSELNLETTNTEGMGADNDTVTTPEQQQQKTYTQEELNSLLDSRISQAYSKWEKKQQKAVQEASKLAQMDAEQRQAYEFEQRVKEFEAKEAEFNKAQFKLQAVEVMSQRGIPTHFADYLVGEDADATLENINVFEKAFKSAVNDAVSKKMASKTPSMGVSQTGMTKESFNKLSIAEQSAIFNSNPTLYSELTR